MPAGTTAAICSDNCYEFEGHCLLRLTQKGRMEAADASVQRPENSGSAAGGTNGQEQQQLAGPAVFAHPRHTALRATLPLLESPIMLLQSAVSGCGVGAVSAWPSPGLLTAETSAAPRPSSAAASGAQSKHQPDAVPRAAIPGACWAAGGGQWRRR
jgi:hypothetical protein